MHYPTFALNTGPPYKMNVANQEMKSNFMKRFSHIMCNFKNVPKTQAFRHQYFFCHNIKSGIFIKDVVELYDSLTLPVEQLPFSQQLLAFSDLNAGTEVQLSLVR